MEPYLEKIREAERLPPHHAALKLWNLPEDWDGSDPESALSASTNESLEELAQHYSMIEERYIDDQEVLRTERQKLERVMKSYYYAQHALMAYAHCVRAIREADKDEGQATTDKQQEDAVCVALSHFCTPDMGCKLKTSSFQRLVMHLLQQANFQGIRRVGNCCYKRRPDHPTAWQEACTIGEFIFRCTQKEYNYDMWHALTSHTGNHGAAVTYLSQCKDPQFPDLIKDRHMFAFRNGTLRVNRGGKTGVEFLPSSGSRDCGLDTRKVACKYFDAEYVDRNDIVDWYDIPTPALQSILDTQEFPPEVSRWLYVFLGRMMFDVNELDRWQVIPFLKGCAATGKSTILTQVCKRMYEPVDVGVLSNNIEKKFGLSALADKYMFIAPEVRDDLGLDQAEFQSLVSGEDMCIARKNLTAQQMQWKTPGILAGNQVPNWRDTAGSIVRRLVVFSFVKQPAALDMTLGDRLEREMEAILQKCARAYKEAVQTHERVNIRKVLPSYFTETSLELQEDVDSIRSFINSGKLRFSAMAYMPFEDFKKMYNEYCMASGFKKEKLSKLMYEVPLLEKTAMVTKEYREWPRGTNLFRSGQWVVGAEEVRETDADEVDLVM